MSTKTLSIELKPETKKAIKYGFAVQASLMIIITAAMIVFAFSVLSDSLFLFAFIMVVALLFLYISKNYLNNLFLKEFIVIEGNSLKILVKKIEKTKTYEFNLNDIIFFGHEGSRKYTEHPMNNHVVDFTGLGTVERELQYLIDEGTIEIETEHKKLRFGKNMTSWDTEEIISEIEIFIGRKLITKRAYIPDPNQEEEDPESVQ
ncbi:MAG: hypothetical protein V4506_01520 [Bacteroidota bacterium]